MLIPSDRQPTVLAMIASSHGLAYALFKGPRVLIEAHVYHVNDDKNRKCLAKAKELLAEFQPDVLVMENVEGKESRRCRRVRDLVGAIRQAGRRQAAAGRQFSRQDIQVCFGTFNVQTRHEIATHLTKWFPKLIPSLPPRRKPWEADNSKMTLFDSVSLAVCYFRGLT